MTFLNKETVARRKKFGRTELQGVDTIRVGNPLREVGDVSSLAASMDKVGLEHPIAVRLVTEGDGGYFKLVSGARRLEAAKALGWDTIECKVYVNMTGDEAEALYIVEILRRLDLTATARKDHVKRYVAALGAKMAKENPGADLTTGGKGRKGVVSQAAKDLKLSKQRVHQILNEDKPKKPKEPPSTGEAAKCVDHRHALFKAMMDACDKADIPISTKVGKACADAALQYFDRVIQTLPTTEPDLSDIASATPLVNLPAKTVG